MCFDDDFERFMANLNLTNITDLSVRLMPDPLYEFPGQTDIGSLYDAMFPGPNPFPTLNKLAREAAYSSPPLC
ncbi:hypothetical protein BD410DRAFT_780652 [Rickenella mellea]|uniref:Uncharacterized protein n=1 Tax=Rickenella mellea TaxID=50990 RepID=A0A4R5XI08_9AGAM|nr:hypothetical protein BD410DRAFT_780652 [Rickenella mellea]